MNNSKEATGLQAAHLFTIFFSFFFEGKQSHRPLEIQPRIAACTIGFLPRRIPLHILQQNKHWPKAINTDWQIRQGTEKEQRIFIFEFHPSFPSTSRIIMPANKDQLSAALDIEGAVPIQSVQLDAMVRTHIHPLPTQNTPPYRSIESRYIRAPPGPHLSRQINIPVEQA